MSPLACCWCGWCCCCCCCGDCPNCPGGPLESPAMPCKQRDICQNWVSRLIRILHWARLSVGCNPSDLSSYFTILCNNTIGVVLPWPRTEQTYAPNHTSQSRNSLLHFTADFIIYPSFDLPQLRKCSTELHKVFFKSNNCRDQRVSLRDTFILIFLVERGVREKPSDHHEPSLFFSSTRLALLFWPVSIL